jgi:hypothetical protein
MPDMLELIPEADLGFRGIHKKNAHVTGWLILFFLSAPGFLAFGQNTQGEATGAESQSTMSRSSIPRELLRPRQDEAPRYPVDTVIGSLGRGAASAEAYAFARAAASALTEGRMNASSLSTVNTVMLETYLSALNEISPRSFRLGGGREEADGAVSFLVRFIGREQSITGELFIRQKEAETAPVWSFEELILEEARSKQNENEETKHRFDFPPYERFF